MADQAETSEKQLPPIKELKVIAYDLLAEIAGYNDKIRTAQVRLKQVQSDILKHPKE